MERRHKARRSLLGGSVGLVLGVTSAGSGALIAVGLIMVFRLTPHRVVGTDVFHAACCCGRRRSRTWPAATSTSA